MKQIHKELIITVQLHGDDDGDDYNETENTLSEILREVGLCDFSLVCNK
jgi:uncharacterized protein YecE (DUF72 family)